MDPGLFRHLVDSIADGIALQDEDGRLMYVNRAFAETLGYEPDELVGRATRSLFSADRQAEFDEQLRRRREGASTPYETVMLARQGEKLVRVSPQPLFRRGRNLQG